MNNYNDQDLILVVDDSEQNVQLLDAYLTSDGYNVLSALNGYEALEHMKDERLPDLIILDIMMPGMNGYEVCREIKSAHNTKRIPVMMLTALQDMEDKVRGFESGADEFLSKPIEKMELLIRVKALLRTKHLNEDLESARDVIYTLALAIEANDPYTRGHSERVADYACRLARKMGLSETEAQTIRNAGILHDVGKIGISEAILQKPGPLTSDEMISVQDHPVIGEKICRPLRSAKTLLEVIRHHQERYDGRGYPDKLKGKDIPVEARIIAVADAYDAMTSPRPYRPPLSHRQVLDILRREAGKQWDPDVVKEFLVMIREEGEIPRKSQKV